MTSNSTDDALIPVTVITGFLGSGKTTILARLLRDPRFADTAVIVNEFGEVGLDHTLLEKADETIVDLSCGCVCCTIRGDLMTTLNDLWERRAAGEIPAFRRVVLETTGLADPAPIIHTLMQELTVFAHYRLARVVTAIDAVNGMGTLDTQPEAIKQAAVADTLLITKTDIANDPAAVTALQDRLAAINPGAPRIVSIDGQTDPDSLFAGGLYDPADRSAEVASWLAAEAAAGESHDHPHDVNRHGDGICAFVIERAEPMGPGVLSAFLQMLADQRGEELLRLKGLVALTDDPTRPAVVHGVQHVIHPTRRLEAWPDGIAGTSIVMIVRGIEKPWVEALLDSVADSPYARLGA